MKNLIKNIYKNLIKFIFLKINGKILLSNKKVKNLKVSEINFINGVNIKKYKYKLYEIINGKVFTNYVENVSVISENFLPINNNIAAENIQSRIRGLLLMTLSNETGKVVLSTGNKSELAVGYSTLYGDMSGSFSPLKDLYKTDIYKLSIYRNSFKKAIP